MSSTASLSVDLICQSLQKESANRCQKYLKIYFRILVETLFTVFLPLLLKTSFRCCQQHGTTDSVLYFEVRQWRNVIREHKKALHSAGLIGSALSPIDLSTLLNWSDRLISQSVTPCYAHLICKPNGHFRLISNSASKCSYQGQSAMMSVAARISRVGGLLEFIKLLHFQLPSVFQPSFLNIQSAFKSLRNFREYCRDAGFTRFWISKLDIEDFFHNIDHLKLLQVFQKVVKTAENFMDEKIDAEFLNLEMDNFLNKYVIRFGGEYFQQIRGIPQGSCISTDLANLFLAQADKKIVGELCYSLKESRALVKASRNPTIVLRYLDDYMCVSTSRNALISTTTKLKMGLKAVGLHLNSNKEEKNITNSDCSVKWLGIEIRSNLDFLIPEIPLDESCRFSGHPRSAAVCIKLLARSLLQSNSFRLAIDSARSSISPFAETTNACRLGRAFAKIFWSLTRVSPQRRLFLTPHYSRRIACILVLRLAQYLPEGGSHLHLARLAFMRRLERHRGELSFLFTYLQDPSTLTQSQDHQSSQRNFFIRLRLKRLCNTLPSCTYPITQKTHKFIKKNY